MRIVECPCGCGMPCLDGKEIDMDAIGVLVGNLVVGAGLGAAFELGSTYRMRAMIGLPAAEDWTPGCGRSAP